MSKYHLFIELSSRQIFLLSNSNIIYQFPVAIGKPSTPTPSGNFSIINKIMHPGGVLGTRWMQFTRQNHGIHGTNQPWLIGQAVSHGCVRMYNSNVETLYKRVNVGTSLIIKPKLKFTKNNNQKNNNSSPKNKQQYIVKKGDSLWKIAREFNTTIQEIKNSNNLNGNTIYPGQKLIIPRG
jgi:hypothetical protein